MVCNWKKVLYELKQSPHNWFDKLMRVIVIVEYKKSKKIIHYLLCSEWDYNLTWIYLLQYPERILRKCISFKWDGGLILVFINVDCVGVIVDKGCTSEYYCNYFGRILSQREAKNKM